MSAKTKHTLTSIAETEVVIEVEGKIVSANFHEIRKKVSEAMKRINYQPKTDEEFGTAKLDIKGLKSLESGFKTAREEGLKKASELYEFFEGMNETTEEIRQNRLKLEKCVKEQTAKVKAEYLAASVEMVDAKNQEFYRSRLESTMARKSSVDAIKAGLNSEVILINSEVKAARVMIESYVEKHGEGVAMDQVSLEVMDQDRLSQTLEARAATLKAEAERKAAEAEAEKLRQEAAAKAKAEAEAEAEAKAKEEAEAKAAAQKAAEAEKAAAPVEEPAKEEPASQSQQEEPVPDDLPQENLTGQVEEWKQYSLMVVGVLKQLKPLREALQNPENKARGEKFSGEVNTLFAKYFT